MEVDSKILSTRIRSASPTSYTSTPYLRMGTSTHRQTGFLVPVSGCARPHA